MRVGALVVAMAAMLPLGVQAGSATPASAASTCRSASHPALAARLSRRLAAVTAGRRDEVGYAVWDPRTGVYCAHHSHWHFDSASVVKATIMGAVLRRAHEQHRYLTGWEIAELRRMITASDNAAASALWQNVGRARLRAFLRLAGMWETRLGPGRYWGLTQITAHDQVRLLGVFTGATRVLSSGERAFALELMHEVEPGQRWGVPYGTPPGVVWHVKNGWLPRATHGWRVHSIGAFTGRGRAYRMAVLTQDNPTMDYGVTTIERIARVVHWELGERAYGATAPEAAEAQQLPADAGVALPSDGSVTQ